MSWEKSNIYVHFMGVDWAIGGPDELIAFEKMHFPGGEINVRIPEYVSHNYDHNEFLEVTAILKHTTDIITLLLCVDALKRFGCYPYNLNIPYFPYARQDRVCNKGEALSVSVMANLINSIEAHEVRIFDAHSDVATALIKNCTNIGQDFFCFHLYDEYLKDLDELCVVSPDAGAEKKAFKFSSDIKKPLIRMTKRRDVMTGDILGIFPCDLIETGKNFIIVDDICDGGRTFVEVAKVLRSYKPKSISLFVTHGIFSKGLEVFDGLIDNIYTTNSFLSEESMTTDSILKVK